VARLATLVVGVAGTGIALVMAATDLRSLYLMFLEVLGLLGGTLTGLFVLGIFSRRANSRGALIGAILSAAIVLAIRQTHPLNVYAYAPIGLAACAGIGWLFSWTSSGAAQGQDGLTIHALKRKAIS
jgi:Na+/proline symporter